MPEEGPFLNLSKREVEAALISDHWNYGSLIHLRTAEALHRALAEPSEPTTGHTVFARLYGEFAATLETLAAVGIAFRARTTPGSFLDAYIGYRTSEVPDFYLNVASHTGDISDLLNLPAPEVVIALGAAKQDDVGSNIDAFAGTLDALYERLKQAASMYRDDERLLTVAYNKTKHGAPLLRLFSPDNAREFELIMRDTTATDDRPFRFAKFEVTKQTADTLLQNVEAMTASIRELWVIARLLYDSGLLVSE